MVERLVDKDLKLRDLYDQARVTASYLKGYSNSLVAGVPSGVVAVDPQGKLTVWNARAQRTGQEFEGHLAAQPGVFRLVDHTHATATELLQDLVVGNGLADHSLTPP